MPNYVHSSPWQDAANFGGAIGDRLTAALIDMPLRKQQYLTQLLQQSAQMKMEQERLGQQQLYQQQQLGQEGKRLDIEQQNVDTTSRHYNDEYIQGNKNFVAKQNQQVLDNDFEAKRLGQEGEKLDIEQQNADATKSHYNDEYIQGNRNLVAKQGQQVLDNDFKATRLEIEAKKVNDTATLSQEKIDALKYNNEERYKMLGQSAAIRLQKANLDQATKTPLPELDGLTMEQAVTLIRRDPAQQSTDPATLKHYQAVIDGITAHLQQQTAPQQGPVLQTPTGPPQGQMVDHPTREEMGAPTLGSAPTKRFKVDLTTGQLIPIQ